METDNKPDSAAVGQVLELAACAGQLGVVQFLCTMAGDNKPDSVAVTQVLELAARAGKLGVVQCLCAMAGDNKPDNSAVGQALELAAYTGQLEIVQFIYAMKTDNKPNSTAVNSALRTAIRANQLNVVQFFCVMNTDNKLDINDISCALECAMNQVHRHRALIDCLEQAKAMSILYAEINKLNAYGDELHTKYPGSSYGGEAKTLAEDLTRLTQQFASLVFTDNPPQNELDDVKNQFKTTLETGYKNLGNHRALWKPVLLNIAIAATMVGLLAIIGKLLLTGTGFFAETERQKKVTAIGEAFTLVKAS